MSKKNSSKASNTLPLLEVEFYIDAAQKHGEDSEPDHEVGDLQDFLRRAWALMSPDQRVEFALSPSVHSTLDGTLVEYEDCVAVLMLSRAH